MNTWVLMAALSAQQPAIPDVSLPLAPYNSVNVTYKCAMTGGNPPFLTSAEQDSARKAIELIFRQSGIDVVDDVSDPKTLQVCVTVVLVRYPDDSVIGGGETYEALGLATHSLDPKQAVTALVWRDGISAFVGGPIAIRNMMASETASDTVDFLNDWLKSHKKKRQR